MLEKQKVCLQFVIGEHNHSHWGCVSIKLMSALN